MEVPYDIDHDGIKVTLVGKISNKSSDVYYGAQSSFLNQKVDFLQLTRELEVGGRLESGVHDYAFSFKNLDLEIDSYDGISIDVQYCINAEMTYAGNMMNYLATASEPFSVSNSV
jgi:hypothetical protein